MKKIEGDSGAPEQVPCGAVNFEGWMIGDGGTGCIEGWGGLG